MKIRRINPTLANTAEVHDGGQPSCCPRVAVRSLLTAIIEKKTYKGGSMELVDRKVGFGTGKVMVNRWRQCCEGIKGRSECGDIGTELDQTGGPGGIEV